MSQLNWDDLTILSAIKNAGTFAGAGAHLRLDETTIARRLSRIQKHLKAPLFDAIDGKRHPTAYCCEILQQVEQITRLIDKIERINPQTIYPTGHLRLASTAAIAENILAPHLADFLSQNPGISIELKSGNQNVKFSNWEADLAIRLSKPAKGAFKIRKLAELPLYLFSPKTLEAKEKLVCCYPEELDQTPEWATLLEKDLVKGARLITANMAVTKTLIASHKAIGILPKYLAGNLFKDSNLNAEPLLLHREAWLLLQPHLDKDPATRLTINWIKACFNRIPKHHGDS